MSMHLSIIEPPVDPQNTASYLAASAGKEFICYIPTYGVFAFLLPCFEAIQQKTMYPLEYYGYWNWFGGDELALLHQGFVKAGDLLAAKPPTFQVLRGVRQTDPPEEVYETVNKAELETLVEKAIEGIEKAQAQAKFILFDGDMLPHFEGDIQI